MGVSLARKVSCLTCEGQPQLLEQWQKIVDGKTQSEIGTK